MPFVAQACGAAERHGRGALGSALYHPVWISAVLSPHNFALAPLGSAILTAWRTPLWVVVIMPGDRQRAAGFIVAATTPPARRGRRRRGEVPVGVSVVFTGR